MKTKQNSDYNGETLYGFHPEPTLLAVTLDVEVDTTTYAAFCFDHDSDIYFNDDDSPTYAAWPKNTPLYLTNKINSVTFSASGTLMYMSSV